MEEFKPKQAKSSMLRTHCQTSGWTLTAQDPYNNVVRTTIEAMAAVFGGTQSLHTNALDEAIALPSEFSARIARNTQLVIQEETHITSIVDPWAGSYAMEALTQQMADAAWKIIEEIEAMGGMTKAVQSGWAKLKIEASAAEKQARIDSGEDVIVGVNKYKLDEEAPIDTLDIDNHAVRDNQVARLKALRAKRDAAGGDEGARRADGVRRERRRQPARALDRGGARARHGRRGERRARGRVGPASRRHAEGLGRLRRRLRQRRGLGRSSSARSPHSPTPKGRRPRVMIAKLGQDGHDRGAKVVASAFADLGFDVDIGPLFQTAEECARQAIENDVHAIGISTLAAGHKTLVPAVIEALQGAGRATTSSSSSAA